MRTVSLAVFIVGLAGATAASAAALAADPASIVLRARPASGSTTITLRDESPTPFAGPILRFIPLPPGAVEPQLDLAGVPAGLPINIRLGEPMTLRGLRLVPVVVSPAPSEATDGEGGGEVPGTLEFSLRYGDDGRAESRLAAASYSRGFFAPYAKLLPEGDRALSGLSAEGGLLIVTVPAFVSTLEPLAAWKREMGFDVTVVTTDETGTGMEDIRDYVRTLYESAPVPPQYLLLAGDVEQVPAFNFHGYVSDLSYGLVDGDDFLPDLEVGRLSAQTVEQLATIVAKILRYEQDPYRGTGQWFSHALLVGADYGSPTPVAVSRWCRQQLLSSEVGYTAVDTVFFPNPSWPAIYTTGRDSIWKYVNQGTSILSYRGWARGWQGWEPPIFTVDHIPSLANGWMLPAVFSFVCHTGAFDESECFGEAWLRAGSAASPKGAIGFIGNPVGWSRTRFNDAAATGAFNSIREQGIRSLGQILNAAKSEIFNQFPDNVYYAIDGELSVELYYHVYSLLGDPSLEIWTAAPETLAVVHPDSIARGSTLVEVRVFEVDGVTPVADARVGVSQGGTVLGCVRTDALGLARILADFEETSASVKVTVTGTGLAPYRDSLRVVEGTPFIAYHGLAITDDGTGASAGNGDGVANPGEVLELRATLQNRGSAAVTGVAGALAAGSGGTVVVGETDFPDLDPGESAGPTDPFVVSIAGAAEDALVVPFRLQITADGDTSVAGFDLRVEAPDLRYESCAIGGDGVLDPGETASLLVTVLNEGSIPATASQGILRTAASALVAVRDSLATFDAVPVGLTGTQSTPFTVEVEDTAAVGQAAVFTLALTTAEGYQCETSFSIVLGRVDHRAPFGPDAYGYYAYDNSDTDYPDAAPAYEWISCSTVYGGAGTPLNIADDSTRAVQLPFPFTFYGKSYDSLLVCDNGWASFDTKYAHDFFNWGIPSPYGNGARLAPFWDNLKPDKSYGGSPVGDGVYTFYDAPNNRFVVEWSRLGNMFTQHPAGQRYDYDDLQTFELILFDPAHYPTPTGDGIIRFQYKQVVNNDADSALTYSTVGIEDSTRQIGLQYTYGNIYPAAAAPLSAGLAIDFTTRPPHYDPFRLAWFSAARAEEGVQLAWQPGDQRPRSGYRIYRAGEGGEFRLVRGGMLGPGATGFLDQEARPESFYRYRIGSVDLAGYETLLGPFAYDGGTASTLRLALENAGPNPSPGPVLLRFSLPERSAARLRIYSVGGRLVRTVAEEVFGAGVWTVRWDGRDEQGSLVPSGVYFGRLEAGTERRRVKITVLR